jgi:hypothetical protein
MAVTSTPCWGGCRLPNIPVFSRFIRPRTGTGTEAGANLKAIFGFSTTGEDANNARDEDVIFVKLTNRLTGEDDLTGASTFTLEGIVAIFFGAKA